MSTTSTVRRAGHPALAEVRLHRARRAEADLALIRSVVGWAVEHEVPADSEEAARLGPLGETDLALAGPGAPHVGEFALYELATALGRTIDSTKSYVGDILEVRYRLPDLWERVASGGLAPWRAFRIAQHTRDLPVEGARYVDSALAPFACTVGNAQLDRTLTHAMARYAPEEAQRRADAAAEKRHVSIDLSRQQLTGLDGLDGLDGTVTVEATLDVADAVDLEHAVRGVADQRAALGSTETRDVRRAAALGEMARAQLTLDLTGEAPAASPSTPTCTPTATSPTSTPQACPGRSGSTRCRRGARPRAPGSP